MREGIAGLTAGSVSTICVHPLDLIKTRLQSKLSVYCPNLTWKKYTAIGTRPGALHGQLLAKMAMYGQCIVVSYRTSSGMHSLGDRILYSTIRSSRRCEGGAGRMSIWDQCSSSQRLLSRDAPRCYVRIPYGSSRLECYLQQRQIRPMRIAVSPTA